jgi:nucleoside-diphosphate-sugar epimerase
MATLVTGAGLIGTSFARAALKRGEKVVFLDPEPRGDFLRFKLGTEGYDVARKDVRDLPALIETIDAHGVETVVHTAGLIGGRVQQSLSLAFDINLGGTRNVAEAVRLTGVRRLVHISTFGVYDLRRPVNGKIGEDFPQGGTRGYGNYKSAKELILEAYAQAHGFELVILRPANVFGLGHFWSGSSGGQKMQALIEAGLDNRPTRIPSSETMANEYIYATDMGRAVDLAATVAMPDEHVFNIGNGVVTPFSEVVETAKAIFPSVAFEVLAGPAPQSKAAPLDIARAKRSLGWQPSFTLRAAFEDYAAEMRAARAAMRAFDR